MISAGILPSGFCRRIESAASVGSAFSIVTSFSRPRMPSASFTLRPNGEGGEERRIIMRNFSRLREERSMARQRAASFALTMRIAGETRIDAPGGLAGHDQVDGRRTLALLVGLDVEVDALAFVERFQAGALDRRDVHEHVATAVVRLDEAVATLRVEELDDTTLRHREAPLPQCCSTTGPRGAAARPDIHQTGKGVGSSAAVISAGPPREAERQSQRRK